MKQEILQSVDLDGTPTGTVSRDRAHEPPGILHAAFSLVLVDAAGNVLLQKRRTDKTTFGGCWSNSVCSHLRPGESARAAARRRAFEELGVESDPTPVGQFVYRAVDADTGLVEYEVDQVLIASFDSGTALIPDPREIEDVDWVQPGELESWLESGAVPTSPWLPLVHAISSSYLRSVHAAR